MAARLKAPVGDRRKTGGAAVKNAKADVELVQRLLVANGIRVTLNGRCTPALIAAIRKFQKTGVGLENPDGIVDPGGRTWRAGVAKLEPGEDRDSKGGDPVDYVICVRRLRGGKFDAEPNSPASARFLEVPKGATDIAPSQITGSKKAWTLNVLKAAETHRSAPSNNPCGDILLFVHGFNTETKTMLKRHRKIKKHLAAAGFKGVVVSFDWPSNNKAVNYLEDRWDAKKSALKLVQQGIMRFAEYQQEGCEINVHILAHSMGAYVVREAFDDADDVSKIASVSWSVSQVMILSGDISASPMGAGKSKSSSLYRHCVRLTNYFNPYDGVLKLSNVKRVGVSPRLGRIGLPEDAPQKAVNVNCGAYYKANKSEFDDAKYPGHNWYFEDAKVFEDVLYTIQGDIDRHLLPTRKTGDDGGLHFRG